MTTLVLALLLWQAPITVPRHSTITVNASDATSGVAKVELYIDGVLKESRGSSFAYRLPNNLRGTHTFAVKAYDRAGNVGQAQQTITIR